MLFIFRALGFFALGMIFLTPFWLFNARLDRLMPPAPILSPRADAVTARLRGQLATALGGLKQDIRADMCRRNGKRLCVLTVCMSEPETARCR